MSSSNIGLVQVLYKNNKFFIGLLLGFVFGSIVSVFAADSSTLRGQLAEHAHAGITLTQLSKDVIENVIDDCRDSNQISVFGEVIIGDVLKAALVKNRSKLLGSIAALKSFHKGNGDIESSLNQLYQDTNGAFSDVLDTSSREIERIVKNHKSIINLHTVQFRKQIRELHKLLKREFTMLELGGQPGYTKKSAWHDHTDVDESHWKLHGIGHNQFQPNIIRNRDAGKLAANVFGMMDTVEKLQKIGDNDVLSQLEKLAEEGGDWATVEHNAAVVQFFQALQLEPSKGQSEKNAIAVLELQSYLTQYNDEMSVLRADWKSQKSSDVDSLKRLLEIAKEHGFPRIWLS